MSVLAALRWLMGVALLVLLELAAPPGAAAQSCPVSGGDPVPSDSTVVGDSTVVSDSTLLAGSDTTATPEADCPPPPPPPSTQPRNPPSISLAPYNGGYSNRALCAAGCFDATVTLSTPAYVSLDAERSVALVYSSAQAWPQALVQVDAAPNSSDLPNKMSIRLKTASGAWVSFTNGSQEIFYTQGVNSTSRLAAQFDASALATGAHPYTVVVRNWWSDGTYKEWTASIRVLVVNEKSSPFGWGWSLAGLQRLLVQSDGSVAISEGDGSLAFFAKTSSGFITPFGDFSKLTVSSGTYTRTYPDGTRAVFASSGRLSYVQDRWGNRTSYSYDSAGKLTGITDPAGKTLTFAYSSSTGKLSSIKDAGGRYSYPTIDAAGNVTQIRDPLGGYGLQAMSYDSKHRMTGRKDRRSGQWSFTYDAFGKLASDAAPPVTLDGGTSSRPTTSFASWEKAVLPASGKGSSTSPEVRRDPGALRAQITDPRGNVTRLALDRWGAPTRIEEPLGRVTQLARNAAGLVSQTITPSTHRIDYTWDAKGNLLYAYDGFTQRRDTMSYESTYNRLLEHRGGSVYTKHFYTGVNLDSTKVGSATAKATRFRWDSKGRLIKQVDPQADSTHMFYQSTGFQNTDSLRVGKRGSSASNLRRTQFLYDGYGRVSQTKDPLNRTGSTAYDLLNRVTTSTNAAGESVSYAYDALYLTGVTDPRGLVYGFTPNALGWVTSESHPGSGSRSYSYDANGNLKSQTNRRAQKITFSYDALDRITSRVQQQENVTTSYGYAADDRWVRTGSDTVFFDIGGRVTRQTSRGGAVESFYDPKGRRKEVKIGTVSRKYFWGSAGLLDSLQAVDGKRTRFKYDGDRMQDSIHWPTVLKRGTRHSSTHATTGIGYNNSTINTALGESYTRDKLERVDERRRPGSDVYREFSYDAAGRLTRYADYRESQGSCGWDPDNGFVCTDPAPALVRSESYTYDRSGNRTDNSAQYQSGTNRMTSFKGYTLTYDADGNLLRKYKSGVIDQRYTWNSLGQLTQVTNNGVTSASFVYDGWGRRISKGTGARAFYYDYDGDQVLQERSGCCWEVDYTYYPGTDRPHSMRRLRDNAKMYYYETDQLGSVIGMTNDSNAVVNQQRYTPWGETDSSQPYSYNEYNPVGFTGREWDAETKLYFYRARYYDPQLGRFLSEDPIGLAGGINPYAYAANDPVNATDPYGLDTTACYDPDGDGECGKSGDDNGGDAAHQNPSQGNGKGGENPHGGGRNDSGNSSSDGDLGFWYRLFNGGPEVCGNPGSDPSNCITAAVIPGSIGGPGGGILFAKNAAPHIFRTVAGHVNPSMLASQARFGQLFSSVASDPANLRPDLLNSAAARAGVQFFAKQFRNGQVWAQTRAGQIFNAGVNRVGSFR